MTEKYTFEFSGHIEDLTDIDLIEFWGHDAGEFFDISDNMAIGEGVESVSVHQTENGEAQNS